MNNTTNIICIRRNNSSKRKKNPQFNIEQELHEKIYQKNHITIN